MATQTLESTARLCQLLQVSTGKIQKAVTSLAIEPAMILNGICYYDAEAVERIREATRPAASTFTT